MRGADSCAAALDARPRVDSGMGIVQNNATRGQGQRYVVAGKAFTEQYIWSQVIRRRLESQGLGVEVRDGMGSATVFQALQRGQIDCYVDYTGTIWSNYMHRRDVVSPVEMLIDVATYLQQEEQIYCLGPLGFSNDYAFATTRELADRYGLRFVGRSRRRFGAVGGRNGYRVFRSTRMGIGASGLRSWILAARRRWIRR